MVTMDKLRKQLRENINYKSNAELYSLTESLFDEFFKAYVDDDIDTEKLNDLIDFDERIKKLKDSDA